MIKSTLPLLFCLLTLPMKGQQARALIELPDVDAAILATEMMQTDSMAQACRMLEMAGFHLQGSCYGTARYSYLMPKRDILFTLTQQPDGPGLRYVSFSAPAVERLLPETLRRLGYQMTERVEGTAQYRHKRLGFRATVGYQPAWNVVTMTLRLADKE